MNSLNRKTHTKYHMRTPASHFDEIEYHTLDLHESHTVCAERTFVLPALINICTMYATECIEEMSKTPKTTSFVSKMCKY